MTSATTPEDPGWTLRRERKSKGITARHVASIMGLSAQYLSDMEQGRRRMSPEHMAAYRAAIGLPVL